MAVMMDTDARACADQKRCPLLWRQNLGHFCNNLHLYLSSAEDLYTAGLPDVIATESKKEQAKAAEERVEKKRAAAAEEAEEEAEEDAKATTNLETNIIPDQDYQDDDGPSTTTTQAPTSSPSQVPI